MPDREKVIKEYEVFVDKYECFSSSDDYVLEMHKAVLALLKEQEAVSITTDYFDGFGNRTSHCPSCYSRLVWHQNKNYCGECGKRIEWEGR